MYEAGTQNYHLEIHEEYLVATINHLLSSRASSPFGWYQIILLLVIHRKMCVNNLARVMA